MNKPNWIEREANNMLRHYKKCGPDIYANLHQCIADRDYPLTREEIGGMLTFLGYAADDNAINSCDPTPPEFVKAYEEEERWRD